MISVSVKIGVSSFQFPPILGKVLTVIDTCLIVLWFLSRVSVLLRDVGICALKSADFRLVQTLQPYNTDGKTTILYNFNRTIGFIDLLFSLFRAKNEFCHFRHAITVR